MLDTGNRNTNDDTQDLFKFASHKKHIYNFLLIFQKPDINVIEKPLIYRNSDVAVTSDIYNNNNYAF